MISDYKIAKKKLLTDSDDECQQFFMQKGYALEYGYSLLINDELEESEKIFKINADSDIRAKWALYMISLIRGSVGEYPTYLSIRNFLEIDLNILIHYCKGDYVEKIVRYADFMYTINPEVYKFIGRVFYNNDLYEQAMFFLNRAWNYFYNDPELHYLLAYIYYNGQDYAKAQKSAQDCLGVLPNYYPACEMLRKLDGRY